MHSNRIEHYKLFYAYVLRSLGNVHNQSYTGYKMTRRQKRYIRRQENRKSKRMAALAECLKFENIISNQTLYDAAKKAAKGVDWKYSVQKYIANLFINLAKTKRDLILGRDVRRGFIEFNINERGKLRHIKSVHFSERVVQQALCRGALIPVLTHNLVTNNSASQKGKGTHYAIRQATKDLVKFSRKYKNDGYVLAMDFKGYFENIAHEPLKEIYKKHFSDERVLKLTNSFVDAFGDKGLGLGSETSQISAVAYINEIDHYITEVLRLPYGRYMDDSYILCPDKEHLEYVLATLRPMYEKYGIILNPKKTVIRKLKHGFNFLKVRFSVTDTGKILKKPCRDSITKERQRLKKQKKLFDNGILDMKTIEQSYFSWRGSMENKHARKTIYIMDRLYNDLFKKEKEEKS